MPLGTVGPEASYAPEEKMPTLKEYLSKEAVLKQEPGLSFSYSNVGFNLLELMIEEVTGRDFAEYMEEEVLISLGMKNSSFNWNKKWEPAVPNGYDLKGNPIPVYVYPDKAAGNLFATVKDIATFITAGMTDFSKQKVLNSQSINKLYSPVVDLSGEYGLAFDSYGLGHFIEKLSNGNKAVSHGGQGSGWMTHFHFLPETGDGIVILTNSQRSWPVFSYILSDWAEWSGISSVGMEQIIRGQKVLWIFIGLFLFILLWQV
jgi:CubicO group peptidase (beta-lactamase class C family)